MIRIRLFTVIVCLIIITASLVINLIIGLSVNAQREMQHTQNIKIQELQKTVFDLQLESILLSKRLTPEQAEEIVTEIRSRVGGSTDLLTPEQAEEIVTEIVSRVGGSTEVLTPEQTVEIITEILSGIGGF